MLPDWSYRRDRSDQRAGYRRIAQYSQCLYRDVEPAQITRERLRPYVAWIKSSIDELLVRAAWLLSDRHGVSHWDGLIVAAAQRARCDVRYSEDMQSGRVFDGTLRVVNPFIEGSEISQYSVQEPKAIYNLKRSKRSAND